MALEYLLDLELVADAMDRVVIKLPHQVLLQDFAPRLHLEMFRRLRRHYGSAKLLLVLSLPKA